MDKPTDLDQLGETVTWPGDWFEQHLACPYDGDRLAAAGQQKVCLRGHSFPVVHGVPVLLRDDVPPSHHIWKTTAADIARMSAHPQSPLAPGVIEPFVERWLVGTCGLLYRRCHTPLAHYPIPDIGLGNGSGRTLLDVGSNWGRWALAASKRGFRAIALDPSLEAALAGQRVARQLALPVSFVVGDARHLPFRPQAFDVVFSYSVLQHLDKATVRVALREMNRVRRREGIVRVQMANVLGLRQLSNHVRAYVRKLSARLRRRPYRPYPFRIRAWTPSEILDAFATCVGPATFRADGYLSLAAHATDLDLLPPPERVVVQISTAMSAIARHLRPLAFFADSIVVEAVSAPAAAPHFGHAR